MSTKRQKMDDDEASTTEVKYKFVVGSKEEQTTPARIVFLVREGIAQQVLGAQKKWQWVIEEEEKPSITKTIIDMLPPSVVGLVIDSLPTTLTEANTDLTEKYVMLHLVHGGEPPFQKQHVIVECKSTRAGEYSMKLVGIEIHTPEHMVAHDLLQQIGPYCRVNTYDCDFLGKITLRDYDIDYAKGHSEEGGTHAIVVTDAFINRLRDTLDKLQNHPDEP